MIVATELATSAVWDAALAAAGGGEQRSYAAAVAATLAAPAADRCANLNTQVHGGIAITWEHDAHLFMRRATTLLLFLQPDLAAADLTALTRRGGAGRARSNSRRRRSRSATRSGPSSPASMGLGPQEQRDRLIETGYVMPHWPRPYGRAAGAVEQLVVEAEFAAAGVVRPSYGITAWVILTLIQYATEDQLARWILPALRQEVIWCQLFSEPDAGSDAAGITTRATRVDGGGWSTGRRCGPREPTWPGWGSPRCAPTPTSPSTRASPSWSSTCTQRGWRSDRSR